MRWGGMMKTPVLNQGTGSSRISREPQPDLPGGSRSRSYSCPQRTRGTGLRLREPSMEGRKLLREISGTTWKHAHSWLILEHGFPKEMFGSSGTSSCQKIHGNVTKFSCLHFNNWVSLVTEIRENEGIFEGIWRYIEGISKNEKNWTICLHFRGILNYQD